MSPFKLSQQQIDVASAVVAEMSHNKFYRDIITTKLKGLSENISIENIDVHPLAVEVGANSTFTAIGTVYFAIEFTKKMIVAEELPVAIAGRVAPDGKRVELDSAEVDLSPLAA